MDNFQTESFLPMSIDKLSRPFDSKEFIYELKLNGIRCIAYIDETSTTLRDKNNISLNEYFPELLAINAHVKCKCILDGEIIVLKRGVSDKAGIDKRMPTGGSKPFSILYKEFPASFIAFDILYMNNKSLVKLPLMERKKLLEETVNDSMRLATSRYVWQHGISMFYLAKRNKLDGVIAKHIKSLYHPGIPTKEWFNILVSAYHYYVVCGYYIHDNGKIHIILGQYREKELLFKGKIETDLDLDFMFDNPCKRVKGSPFRLAPVSRLNIIWLTPTLVCEILNRDEDEKKTGTKSFIRLLTDRLPSDCTEIN
ncbi:MAG: dependent ligase [Anaerocolumna sp.]|jgi:ATP-dependent DNA ligase|nr:dependent ligase [Anaerocolumna sp.]